MGLLEVLLTAVGLAMDCFAVAVASGIAQMKQLDLRKTLTMAVLFGGFQTGMPLAGWAAGLSLRHVIGSFDHWLAFALLGCVGGKMIFEASRNQERGMRGAFSPAVLIVLAFATSIDALAVGVSFAFLRVRIFQPAMVIGLVSLLFTLAGVNLGRKMGAGFGRKAEVLGGFILIGMGIKILLEHLR